MKKTLEKTTLSELKALRKELINDLEKVTLAINALELPKRKIPVDEDYLNEHVALGVLQYHHNMSIEQKVLHALEKIGAGDATDIGNYILMIDKVIKNDRRVYQKVTVTCSRLFRQGVIEAVKQGRRNLYKLKCDS
ncbi:hypothetical protein [Mucilaginibacter straminoryzae]|nr:hypothetical protein [Mucilaginibacter straminoryzae]